MQLKTLLFILFLTSFAFGFERPKQSSPRKEMVLSELTDWRSEVSTDSSLVAREKDLRLQFINRLIFQVERKYQEKDLCSFIASTVDDMKQIDTARENKSYGGLADYLDVLHAALQEVIEPHENVVDFIEEFTDFTSIENPKTLDEFAETRDYSDGKEMIEADSMDIDQAAESVAEKISEDEEKSIDNKDYLNLQKNLTQDEDFQFVLPVQEDTNEPVLAQSPEPSHSQIH